MLAARTNNNNSNNNIDLNKSDYFINKYIQNFHKDQQQRQNNENELHVTTATTNGHGHDHDHHRHHHQEHEHEYDDEKNSFDKTILQIGTESQTSRDDCDRVNDDELFENFNNNNNNNNKTNDPNSFTMISQLVDSSSSKLIMQNNQNNWQKMLDSSVSLSVTLSPSSSSNSSSNSGDRLASSNTNFNSSNDANPRKNSPSILFCLPVKNNYPNIRFLFLFLNFHFFLKIKNFIDL